MCMFFSHSIRHRYSALVNLKTTTALVFVSRKTRINILSSADSQKINKFFLFPIYKALDLCYNNKCKRDNELFKKGEYQYAACKIDYGDGEQ